MILSSPLIQALAAFVIFVVGYLALLVAVVACLGTAIVFYKAAHIIASYVMSTMRRAWSAPAKVALVTHPIARPSR